MDIKLQAVLVGFVLGAVGYWFTTFIMQPILRFREIRNQILMDFIYYAQAVSAEDYNEEIQKLFRERILANRKASAQLSAAVLELPRCYLWLLKMKGQDPKEAAKNHLIGYANTTDYDQADRIENFIRGKLGLPFKT